MSNVIVFGLGTAAGAVLCHFSALLRRTIEGLRRELEFADRSSESALEKRVQDIEETFILRAFDVNASNVYPVPPSPFLNGNQLKTGELVKVPMPSQDLFNAIISGRLEGYSFLNPEAARALNNSEHASGGARPNGYFALASNRDLLDRELRAAFRTVLTRRQRLASEKIDHPHLVLVAGLFGGFGSGTLQFVNGRALEIAAEVGLAIELEQVLLLPGANLPKDPANTNAVAYGVLKELSAVATGNLTRRIKRSSSAPPMNHRVPSQRLLLLSDVNAAPGVPKALSIPRFHAAVAELLRTSFLTPVGAVLEGYAGDFAIAGAAMNMHGERRYGRSAGLSVIVLDRDRIFEYLTARLSAQILSAAQVMSPDDELRAETRSFLEANRFVEGKGRRDLSSSLLEPVSTEDLTTPARFRNLFRGLIEDLQGTTLLIEGRTRLAVATEQCGDIHAALAKRQKSAVERMSQLVRLEIDRHVRQPLRGLSRALQFARTLGAVLDRMAGATGEDTLALQDDCERIESAVKHIENDYAPSVCGRSAVYRSIHRRQIEQVVSLYARQLEDMHIARMSVLANMSAKIVISAVLAEIRTRLCELERAFETIVGEHACALAAIERAAGQSADFSCPNGLSLLAHRSDLEDLAARLPLSDDEQAAAARFRLRLSESEAPLSILTESSRLRSELGAAIRSVLWPRIDSMHVVDELLRQYPQGSDGLAAVLRERDLESFERIRLKGSSEHESPLTVVRLLALDASKSEAILAATERHGCPRGSHYQIVDTADRDRIAFVQFRAVFPFSDWAGIDSAFGDYTLTKSLCVFERHHVFPGDRFLPDPGRWLTAPQKRGLLFRAWATGRLRWDERLGWCIESSDQCESPTPLGHELQLFDSPEAYSTAVDVISHFNCWYLQHGPDATKAKLESLANPASEFDRRVAVLVDDNARQAIEAEVEWWRRNSIPATQEWVRHR